MATFSEVIESITADKASPSALFGGDGIGMRSRKKAPEYQAKVAEAATLVSNVINGRVPTHYLREAMSTSDFPLLFGDVIDRLVLAGYREAPVSYPAWAKVTTVPDFRTVERFYIDGGDAVLEHVPEGQAYPAAKLDEGHYTYAVKKYGRIMPFLWETMINDDLAALKDTPQRFGRAARRSVERFATGLICDAAGPAAGFFNAGNGNLIVDPLTVAGLQAAVEALETMTDPGGEPIDNQAYVLMVPPGLRVTAMNILNAIHIEALTGGGGDATQTIRANNWMSNLQMAVLPYIPGIVQGAVGKTCWFLGANPNEGRGAVELGFLRGHEEPELFMKAPNANRVGGGEVSEMDGDFDNDSITYKVRHVFGGGLKDYRYMVASTGAGAGE